MENLSALTDEATLVPTATITILRSPSEVRSFTISRDNPQSKWTRFPGYRPTTGCTCCLMLRGRGFTATPSARINSDRTSFLCCDDCLKQGFAHQMVSMSPDRLLTLERAILI